MSSSIEEIERLKAENKRLHTLLAIASKQPQTDNLQRYATPTEVALALSIRLETLSRWTTAKLIPSIRISRKVVRYDRQAIADFIANRCHPITKKMGEK